MLENSDDLMSIVVLEAGTAWPAWLAEYQRIAPNAVVVAQAHLERTDVFRSRVLHRIEEATSRSGARVRVGVIVVADSTDCEKLNLRESVARGILKAMGSHGEAELVLAGDGGESAPSRHELFALAGVLCEELGGTNVSVRVRFTGKSGVMRALGVGAFVAETEALSSKGGA